MGTPLGPKYIPYTYMDPLGKPEVSCLPPGRRRWIGPCLSWRKRLGSSVMSPKGPCSYMSYSLNSLKGGYIGDYIGDYYRGY